MSILRKAIARITPRKIDLDLRHERLVTSREYAELTAAA